MGSLVKGDNMKYLIKKIDNKFYVFTQDQYGNLFDSMHHFLSKAKAIEFIKSLKG